MYVSNVALSHAANTFYCLQKGEKRTFRGYMKPTVTGGFMWRFTYRNTVDSTWADGSRSYADLPGGHFRILHAAACTCSADLQVLKTAPVLFDGSAEKELTANEQVNTDPVFLEIQPNGYVMFNWCVEALEDDCVLPATPDSRALVYIAAGNEDENAPLTAFRPLNEEKEEPGVLPWLWAVERKAQCRMAFIGDSITQGCQTRLNHYEQWASRIIRGLPENMAGLNVGLGYARARDAARNGAWLKKLKDCDVVNVCLGVNDILHTAASAETLVKNLETVVRFLRENRAGVKVVLFTVPPFSMKAENEAVREQVNACIRQTKLGADAVFDMEILAVPDTRGKARFGAHPDGAGGAVVAETYLSRFLPEHRHLL